MFEDSHNEMIGEGIIINKFLNATLNGIRET